MPAWFALIPWKAVGYAAGALAVVGVLWYVTDTVSDWREAYRENPALKSEIATLQASAAKQLEVLAALETQRAAIAGDREVALAELERVRATRVPLTRTIEVPIREGATTCPRVVPSDDFSRLWDAASAGYDNLPRTD
jgi:hypothetical protein